MHTFEGKTCRIHHNSDLSGEIIINPYDGGDLEIRVDAQDILDFVADYVKSEKIARIEQMGTKEVLIM